MVYVMMEQGFEETELLVPVDILRRGGVSVCIVGVSGMTAQSSRGVTLAADAAFDSLDFSDMEMLFLPGGQPGVDNLGANPRVMELIERAAGNMPIAAICAAPMLLGKLGLLSGRRATCYPGCETALCGARIEDKSVVVDGSYITARGAGAAFRFAFTLLATLRGAEAADAVARAIQYRDGRNG